MNFTIDLTKAKESHLRNPSQDDAALLFENINVEFALPDGSEKIFVCSIGETVEMVRERLAANGHCPFTSEFYLDGMQEG